MTISQFLLQKHNTFDIIVVYVMFTVEKKGKEEQKKKQKKHKKEKGQTESSK